jgi:PAS domain S-box-containing protein
LSESRRKTSYTARLGRIIGIVVLAMVTLSFLVAPFLAWRWSRLPFMGMMLEPTLVLSPLQGKGWARLEFAPPLEQPDHLVAIDGQPVQSNADVEALLRKRAVGDSVQVRVDRTSGSQREETIVLTAFPLRDLVLVFVIPYIVGLCYLLIAGWVFWARGWDRAGLTFVGVSSAFALILGGLFDLNTTHRLSGLWSAAVPLAAAGAMHLAMVFPREPRFVRRVPVLRLLPYVPALVLAIRALLEVYDAAHPWTYIERWRNSYLFAALGILFLLGMLIYRLIRPAAPLVRQQSRIILLGSALGFTPILPWLMINVLGTPAPFLPTLYVPLFVLFPLSIAYAVMRYRLLDVDRFLSRGLAYGVLTVVVVGAYFALINGLSFFAAVRADDPIILSLFVLILVLVFNPLRNWVQRFVDRVFLREPVDYRSALQDFSHKLTKSLDLEAVLAEVSRRIEDTLHPAQLWVFLFDEEEDAYVGLSVGLMPSTTFLATFAPDGALARWMYDHQECLYLPTERDVPAELVEEWERMRQIAGALYVPLRTRERLSGWLTLGPKRSGQPYRSDDMAFLSALADQSALAVDNARLFASARRSLETITEMQTLMYDIFSSIASGVITTDIRDRVTLINRAAESILGLDGATIIGRPYRETLLPLKEVLPYLVGQIQQGSTALTSYEVQTDLPEHGQVWLRLNLSPLKDSRGVMTGVTIVIDDLTEQRRLEAQERFIRETFQRYVSPAVVLRLLEEPSGLKLGGQRQEVTVLFADLRGFTAFSEDRDPEKLVEVLNNYLSVGAEAILAEEGTLDKFMGDALMALFNAPLPQTDHTLRAVRAALRAREAIATLHQVVPPIHQLHYGVGIAVGEAVVGNVGTSQQLDYTAIGACTNLARRLQENALPGQILLNKTAYERVQPHISARPLEPMLLEGFSIPLQVYEVLGLEGL